MVREFLIGTLGECGLFPEVKGKTAVGLRDSIRGSCLGLPFQGPRGLQGPPGPPAASPTIWGFLEAALANLLKGGKFVFKKF